jgi:putative membrane protein
VDKTLLPSAKNAELKSLLEKVRPALVQHLEHARHLQSQLGR